MRNRVIIIIVSIAVAFGLVSGWACAGLSPKADRAKCQEKGVSEKDSHKVAPGNCHVTPCQAQDGQVFILPDTSTRRGHSEKGGSFSAPAAAARPQTASAQRSFQPAGKYVLKLPPLSSLTPLYSLHCVYIC